MPLIPKNLFPELTENTISAVLVRDTVNIFALFYVFIYYLGHMKQNVWVFL